MSSLRSESIPILADVVKEYIPYDDLEALCQLFEVAPEYRTGLINYIALARKLVVEIEHGNNWRLLETIISTTKTRCLDRIAHTKFERREYHEAMLERIETIESELSESQAPPELSVPESHPFTAKSELRNMLATAETEVLVVDKYVGPATLDCLIDVGHPIRLLTGTNQQSIGHGFDRALGDFLAEGKQLEVRQHERFHDRHIIFNNRCWLLGSSIKDAGKKSFNLIEIIDEKAVVIADIEQKWSEAAPFKV